MLTGRPLLLSEDLFYATIGHDRTIRFFGREIMSNRNRSAGTLAALICFFTLTGCVVQSVNPFFTKDLAMEMPAVSGQWTLIEGSVKEDLNKTFTFTKDTLLPPDSKDKNGVLTLQFFKIDDMLFLDLIATDPPQCNSIWWVTHVSPMHTVSRVIAEEKTLKIIPLNASWMEEAVKNKTIALPSVWHNEQNFNLFTASPEEWVSFLKKYGKDPQAFPEKNAFVFTRTE